MGDLSRDNHYVPQMYLSNWMTGKGIYEYRLLVSHQNVPLWNLRQSTKSTASMHDLYIRSLYGAETDDIELEFNRRFETPARDSLGKVLEDKSLTKDDWRRIVEFICSQYVRTPAFYQWLRNRLKETVPDILGNILSDLKESLENGKHPKSHHVEVHEDMIPLKVTKERDTDGKTLLGAEVVVGKSIWLDSMLKLMNENSVVYKSLQAMKWTILTVDPNVIIPTTDNPVIIAKKVDNNRFVLRDGLGWKNSVVIYPLSPQKVLIGCKKRELGWKMSADYELSLNIKQIIVKNSFLFVYSNYEDSSIPEIKPRVVDKETYERIESEFRDWHESYREKEVPLLNRNTIEDITSPD